MPGQSKKTSVSVRLIKHCLACAVCLTSLVVASCASNSARYVEPPDEPANAQPFAQVYFYPNLGQGADQQDRDRYECYLWARSQTGFDPSAPQLAPHQRLVVVPQPPPGYDTAVGAGTGAMLGAIVSSPGNAGEGALIGAVAGAVLGATSDAARQNEAERIQERYDRQTSQRSSYIEQKASNYRRAMAACLEGRGYTVR